MSETAEKVKWSHTPGPWLHADDYITAGSYTIARIFPGTGNDEANAKLIAKAPQMAELLREWLATFGSLPGNTGLRCKTRALLPEIE